MDVPRGDATVSAHGDDDFDVLRTGEGISGCARPELTLNTTRDATLTFSASYHVIICPTITATFFVSGFVDPSNLSNSTCNRPKCNAHRQTDCLGPSGCYRLGGTRAKA